MQYEFVRFEVPTALLVIVHVSWDDALFLLVNIYAHLERVQCLQLEDMQSKKELCEVYVYLA
jgi:hypothetical protein